MMKIHEDIKEIMSYLIPGVIGSVLAGANFWISLSVGVGIMMIIYPIIKYWRKIKDKNRKDKKK